LLLLAHAALSYATLSAAVGGLLYGQGDTFLPIAVGVFTSQLTLSGALYGLNRSYLRATRHGLRPSLGFFSLGLACIWLPIVVLSFIFGELMLVLMFGVFVWLVAASTYGTLRGLSLRISDEPIGAAQSPPFQFSMKQLVLAMTFVAVICALPRLWSYVPPQPVVRFVLGSALVLYSAVVGMIVFWLLTVGVPIFAVMIPRRPWPISLLALTVGVLLAAGGAFLAGARSLEELAIVPAGVGGHLTLVMASLGVLRGCGLRLVRHKPDETRTWQPVDPDFSTWPFDNRPVNEPSGSKSIDDLA
jgi:hypothetical protein